MAVGALNLGTLYMTLTLNDTSFGKALTAVRRKMISFGDDMARVGRNLSMRVTLPLVGIATAGVKAFTSFEQQMAMVSTMLDEQSMIYIPAYTQAVKKMSIEYGEGTATITKGLYDILSATIEPAKALEVLGVSIRAAKAGFTDTAVAADAITTVLNAYQFAAEDAARVSDILFATVKRGKLTFAELAPNIGKVASIASNAGLSFEELSAAISTMTRAGLKADIATTALRGFINTFLGPTEEARKVAQQFGIVLNATTLQTKGLTGVLKELAEQGATAMDIGALIPNVRAMAGATAMLRQLEKAIYDVQLNTDAAGMSNEAFAKATGTLEFRLKQVRQIVVAFGRDIGQLVSPYVEKSIIKIHAWWKKWEELSDETKKYIVRIGILVAALGPVLWILGTLTSLVSGMLTPMKLLLALVIGMNTDWSALIEKLKSLSLRDVKRWADGWRYYIEYVKDIMMGLVAWFKSDWIASLGSIVGLIMSIVELIIRQVMTASFRAGELIGKGLANLVASYFDRHETKRQVEAYYEMLVGEEQKALEQMERQRSNAKQVMIKLNPWSLQETTGAYGDMPAVIDKIATRPDLYAFAEEQVNANRIRSITKPIEDEVAKGFSDGLNMGWSDFVARFESTGGKQSRKLTDMFRVAGEKLSANLQANEARLEMDKILDEYKFFVDKMVDIGNKVVVEPAKVLEKEIDKGPIDRWVDYLKKKFGEARKAGERLFQGWVDTNIYAFDNMKGVASHAMDGVSDEITKMVMGAKADFNSLARSIIAEIINVIVRAQIANAVLAMFGGAASPRAGASLSNENWIGGIGGALAGGLFGGGGGATGGAGLFGGLFGGIGAAAQSGYGVISGAGLPATPLPESTRITPAGGMIAHRGGSVEPWMAVPRYHRGGLAPGEVPAILQSGEYVLNRQQTSQMKDGEYSSSKKSSPVMMNFNISAIDAKGTFDFLKGNERLLASVVNGARGSNHPIRRNNR